MMDPFASTVPLWDLSQNTYPTLPDDDFLALLQKEFPNTNGTVDFSSLVGLENEPSVDADSINPQSLTSAPGGHTPPLTDDSSPSPPATTHDADGTSRRHSGSYADHDGLKRKASDDDFDDGTSHKHPHGGSYFRVRTHAGHPVSRAMTRRWPQAGRRIPRARGTQVHREPRTAEGDSSTGRWRRTCADPHSRTRSGC